MAVCVVSLTSGTAATAVGLLLRHAECGARTAADDRHRGDAAGRLVPDWWQALAALWPLGSWSLCGHCQVATAGNQVHRH